MARVTVEDCLKNVKNRFELVIIASRRARQLMRGKEPKVEWDNDKATVVALREIAEGYTNFDTPSQEEQETAAMLHSLNANSLAKQQAAAQQQAVIQEEDEDDDLEDLEVAATSEEPPVQDEHSGEQKPEEEKHHDTE